MDPGTSELARHFTLRIEAASKYRMHVRVKDGCSIDALLFGNLISLAQHDAGRRFGETCLAARLLGIPGSNPNRSSVTPGSRISDMQCTALAQVGQALFNVTKENGEDAENVLLGVVTEDRAPRRPIEFEQLRGALSSLVVFYERVYGIRRRAVPYGAIRSMIASSGPAL